MGLVLSGMGSDEQVVPEFLGEILLLVDLGIQALHHFHHGIGLFRSFGPVRNIPELLHHLQDVAAVLRHLQLFNFRIVIKLDAVLACFHRRTN